MDSGISCQIIIEKVSSDGTSSTKKYAKADLTIMRNQNRQICLKVTNSKSSLLFKVNELKVHGKFIAEGKATINFKTDTGNR